MLRLINECPDLFGKCGLENSSAGVFSVELMASARMDMEFKYYSVSIRNSSLPSSSFRLIT